jgi:hypothetical protein
MNPAAKSIATTTSGLAASLPPELLSLVDDVVGAEVDEVASGATVVVGVELATAVVGVSSTEESSAPAQAVASRLSTSIEAIPRTMSPPIAFV